MYLPWRGFWLLRETRFPGSSLPFPKFNLRASRPLANQVASEEAWHFWDKEIDKEAARYIYKIISYFH